MAEFIHTQSFEFSCSSYLHDIGGGRIQQDNGCIYEIKHENNSIVCMVSADGHGKYGELASSICVEEIQKTINISNIDKILNNAHTLLEYVFQSIQKEIKTQFLKKYGGSENQLLLCGGTTLTIVLIVNDTIYCANVGDSDALMCIQKPTNISDTLECVLNGNHSAENEHEWRRIRDVKSDLSNSKLPFLNFQYESLKGIQFSTNIFELNDNDTLTSNKELVIKQDLSYFKNVKKELASMVSIPNTRTKLAMTRSLGDFHLKPYGVSCDPEIKTYSIGDFFDKKTSTKDNDILCIILGSDGIWDCLAHNHCSKFVFFDNCIEALRNDSNNGSQRVCESFLSQIKTIGLKKFGLSRDNMSMSLVYIQKK